MQAGPLRPQLRLRYMELTRAELEEGRDRADEAGCAPLFQYYCQKLDELDHEEEQ